MNVNICASKLFLLAPWPLFCELTKFSRRIRLLQDLLDYFSRCDDTNLIDWCFLRERLMVTFPWNCYQITVAYLPRRRSRWVSLQEQDKK